MFTGLIQELGSVQVVANKGKAWLMTVKASPKFVRKMKAGDSVSVDGVCLSIVKRQPAMFSLELMRPTIERTTLSLLKPGTKVNLESAVVVGQAFGGHFVTGHVDGLGKIAKVWDDKRTRYLQLTLSTDLRRYLVPRGSIAINGVSLTIVEVKGKGISVALIPYTRQHTNLGSLWTGDLVNIEIDCLAKYAVRNHYF